MDRSDSDPTVVGGAFAWLYSVPAHVHRHLSAALIDRYGSQRAAELADELVEHADDTVDDLAFTADLTDEQAARFADVLADVLADGVTAAAAVIATWRRAVTDGHAREPLPSLADTRPGSVVDALDAVRAERDTALDETLTDTFSDTDAPNTDDTDDGGGGCGCGDCGCVQVAAERDEHRADLQRLQAEFENYRKRVLAERDAAAVVTLRDTLRALLPVLDDVDLLADHHPDVAAPVAAALAATVARLGVTRIDGDGEPFDPHRHDAAATVDDGDAEPGTVTRTLRCGWAHDGHVLRAALVEVRR